MKGNKAIKECWCLLVVMAVADLEDEWSVSAC